MSPKTTDTEAHRLEPLAASGRGISARPFGASTGTLCHLPGMSRPHRQRFLPGDHFRSWEAAVESYRRGGTVPLTSGRLQTVASNLELYCTVCGNWLDRRWRACPTCGNRLAAADTADRRERVAAIVALAGGAGLVVGSFLPTARINVPLGTSETRWGMQSGRGVPTLILGLIALAVGYMAIAERRTRGNRFTLSLVGLLGLGSVIFQRVAVSSRVNALKSQAAIARNLTAAQLKAAPPSSSYSIGLYLIIVASVVLIGAAIALPRQIAPRHHQAPAGREIGQPAADAAAQTTPGT